MGKGKEVDWIRQDFKMESDNVLNANEKDPVEERSQRQTSLQDEVSVLN